MDWGVEGWGISMKFLGLDLLKDVTLEVARATKEPHLGLAEWHTQFKFRLKKLQHANKVCNLKQLVLARFYRLRKFSRNRIPFGEEVVKEVRYRLLATVIVNLYRVEADEHFSVCGRKDGHLSVQARGDLFWAVSILLVNDDAMVLELYASGKPKHSCKYLAAKIPRQELKLVIRMDYRAGMKTEIGNANGRHIIIEGISK